MVNSFYLHVTLHLPSKFSLTLIAVILTLQQEFTSIPKEFGNKQTNNSEVINFMRSCATSSEKLQVGKYATEGHLYIEHFAVAFLSSLYCCCERVWLWYWKRTLLFTSIQ